MTETTSVEGASSDETTTGSVLVDAPPLVDVTLAAGIDHVADRLPMPPDCLLDALEPALAGFICTPERNASGAAIADIDGDGALDFLVTRPHSRDLLYRGNGDGTFVEVGVDLGLGDTLGTNGAAFADVDDDGDPDLYVTTIGATRHSLFINDGGVFVEEAEARGAAIATAYQHSGTTPGFADYDLDGDLDLYVGEWRTAAMGVHPSHARLLRNLGPAQPGHFEDVTESSGIAVDDVHLETPGTIEGTFVLSVGWSDLDGDDYPDLLLANDFWTSRLFWNEGGDAFIDGTVAAGVGTDENGMGSAIADYDADGDFDWFVTAIASAEADGNRMYRYLGDRMFEDATDDAGVRDSGWAWGATFFDRDHDGDPDLVSTSGWFDTDHLEDPGVAWIHDGDGHYVVDEAATAFTAILQGRSATAFDADGDGDLDLLVVTAGGGAALLRNDLDRPDAHWLRVRAPGTASNRDGIGAVVTIEADGRQQRAEIGGPSHYLGHGPREAHFGLGAAATVDVRVRWPASGAEVVLDDVAVDQILVVAEP